MDTPLLPVEQMANLQNTEQDWLFEKLIRKLGTHRHIILAAEQGWGIQDYVYELGFQLAERRPDMQICHIDIKAAHSPDSFLEIFASGLLLKFPEHSSNFETVPKSLDTLSLPQFIAQKSKISLAIFLLNSHLLHRFRDQAFFLRKLRSKFKNQKNCVFFFSAYINRDFRDLLNFPGPLSGIGQYYELRYNPFKNRSSCIRKLFHHHNKRIGRSTSIRMSSLVENNPFYLNILAWHALVLTRNTCNSVIVEKALMNLLHHYNYHFYLMADTLTTKQLNFLKALVDGNQNLCSRSVREAYQLGASSNIARIKASLEKKGIIRIGKLETAFVDPIFKEWLRRQFFKSS